MYVCDCIIIYIKMIMLYGIIGFLWSGRFRVCCYVVGIDNYEVWVRWVKFYFKIENN